ncbi:hypothetical protein JTB14_013086 [Gonioctena quinquepunctata]|nr:hypothetical protein JTB14_013086 [Gonioctena quinquepunctata]
MLWGKYQSEACDHEEVHAFCDSSEEAFAGAVYLRIEKNAKIPEIAHSSVNKILVNQNRILQQLDKLKASFNVFAMNCSHHTMEYKTTDESATADPPTLVGPINSKENLDKIEEQLKSEKFMENLVESMTFICGQSGYAQGIDCCYKLVDYFFEREFLVHCSWTGNTKESGGSSKVPLKFYVNMRRAFLNIILRADNSFTETECDTFFKRIMKNSKQRTTMKNLITSKHKSRPKNLKYKKFRVDNTDAAHSGAAVEGLIVNNNEGMSIGAEAAPTLVGDTPENSEYPHMFKSHFDNQHI